MAHPSDISLETHTDTEPAGSQPGLNRPLSPLWFNRNFMLLWSGSFISSIGSQVSELTFPLLVLAVTFSPVQAGIVGALRSVPFVILCLPAGALVDRWNRKKVMILCDSGRALVLASIPLALWMGQLGLAQLYLVALVEGTLSTFFSIASMASLPRVVPKEQIAAATSQNQFIDTTSWLVGPLLGGLLYGLNSILPFLVDAISYLCSVLGLLLITARFQEERNTPERRIWGEIQEGFHWLWQEPLLRFLALLTFGLITPSIGYPVLLVALAQSQHATAFEVGVVFAAGGLGSIVGAFLTQPLQKRLSFGQLVIGSSWVWAISWLLLAIAPNLPGLCIANGLTFIIAPIYLSSLYTYRLVVVPDRLQGRVQSVFRLISFGAQPLGLAVTGLLIQSLGAIWAVVLLFLPQALFALIATINSTLRKAPNLHQFTNQQS